MSPNQKISLREVELILMIFTHSINLLHLLHLILSELKLNLIFADDDVRLVHLLLFCIDVFKCLGFVDVQLQLVVAADCFSLVFEVCIVVFLDQLYLTV